MGDIISTMELMETAYSNLQKTNPEHELLKYWTPEEYKRLVKNQE